MSGMNFSADEVIRVIEVCSRSGVQLFKSGDLEVHFRNIHAPIIAPVYVPEEVVKVAESQAREELEKEEVEYKREELEDMLINDPARLEELIRSGDLIDEKP